MDPIGQAPCERRTSARSAARRVGRTAALAAVVCSASVWAWEAVLRDRLVPKRFGVVVEGRIFRSGQLSAPLVERVLKEHGIQVVIDLTADQPDNLDQRAEADAALALGIERVKLPLAGDGTGSIEQYAEAVERIDRARRAGQPVLVHCAAGAQRTGGIVAAYRLLVEGAPPAVVEAEMLRYGWDPARDRVLVEFLNGSLAQLARLLVARGVIDRSPDPLPRLGR